MSARAEDRAAEVWHGDVSNAGVDLEAIALDREIIGAASMGDKDAIAALMTIPLEDWPSAESHDIACAIQELVREGREVSANTITAKAKELEVFPIAGPLAEMECEVLTRLSEVQQFDWRADKIRESAEKRRFVEKTRRLVTVAAILDPTERRTYLADLDLEGECSTAAAIPEPVNGTELLKNPPEIPPEIIHGVLRRGHKMLVSGPSKAGKSYLMIELAVSVITGTSWLDRYPCERGRVLIVNLEISAGSYWKRVTHVATKITHTDADYERLAIWNLRGVNMPLDVLVKDLIRCAKGFDLIIFDPVYKILAGADENAAGDIGAVLEKIDQIAQQTGAAVAMVHHFAKGAAGGKDAIDRASGSGVFARDPDALCTMTPLENEQDVYRLEWVLREFKSPEPMALEFQHPVHVERPDLDGARLRGAPGRPPKVTASAVTKALTQLDNPTVAAVAEVLGVGKRTVYDFLKDTDTFTNEGGIVRAK